MNADDATWSSQTDRSASSGWHVEVVKQTGSTNADLLAKAAAGAPDRSVLAARHQTAGRGRLDRRWEAPSGANLLVSMLFRQVPTHPHELTQRVALAAAVAVERCAGVRATLKWPNDLLLAERDPAGDHPASEDAASEDAAGEDAAGEGAAGGHPARARPAGAKLAGVLAQAGVVGGRVDHVVVGIGINVGWAPEGGAHLDAAVTPLALLDAMLCAYDELDDDVFPQYRARLGTLGQRVRVELPGDRSADAPNDAPGGVRGGVLEGRAIDVGRDGRLAVLDDCGITHHIGAADVIHLRHRQG
jgi:BirA family transcriptional regulator, biotin operon repressor / biotin---[acetyl-CoA-carboxylase] ligase